MSFKNVTEFYSPHVNKENSLAELNIYGIQFLESNDI